MADITLDVDANTKPAEKNLRNLSGRLQKGQYTITSAISRAGTQLSVALTAPLLLAGKAALTAAADVELLATTTASLSAVGGSFDNVAQVAKDIAESAVDVARDVKFTTTEIAASQVVLARAGFSTNTILKEQGQIVRDLSSFAAASNIELEKAADLSVKALGALGFTTPAARLEEFGKLTDVLTVTASKSATNVTELGKAITYAGPLAATLGVTTEDLSASLGVLANAGFTSTLAGTGLRAIFKGLVAPTDTNRKKIEDLGVSITDASGEFVGITKVVQDFAKGFEDAGASDIERTELAMKLFGQRGGPAFLNILNEANGSLPELRDKLNDVEGATEAVEDALLNTASGQFAILRSSVENLGITLVNAGLLDFTKQLTIQVKDLANSFSEVNAETLNTVVASGAALAALGPVIRLIGFAVDNFRPLFRLFTTVGIPAFTTSVAPILAIAEGLRLAYQNSEDLQGALRRAGTGLNNLIGGGGGANILSGVIDSYKEMETIIGPSFQAIGDGLGGALNDIFDSFDPQGLADGITDIFDGVPAVINSIIPEVERLGRAIKGVFTDLGGVSLELLVQSAKDAIEFFGTLAIGLGELIEIATPLAKIALEITSGFLALADSASIVGDLLGGFLALKLLSVTGLFKGFDTGLSKIGKGLRNNSTQFDAATVSAKRYNAAIASGVGANTSAFSNLNGRPLSGATASIRAATAGAEIKRVQDSLAGARLAASISPLGIDSRAAADVDKYTARIVALQQEQVRLAGSTKNFNENVRASGVRLRDVGKYTLVTSKNFNAVGEQIGLTSGQIKGLGSDIQGLGPQFVDSSGQIVGRASKMGAALSNVTTKVGTLGKALGGIGLNVGIGLAIGAAFQIATKFYEKSQEGAKRTQEAIDDIRSTALDISQIDLFESTNELVTTQNGGAGLLSFGTLDNLNIQAIQEVLGNDFQATITKAAQRSGEEAGVTWSQALVEQISDDGNIKQIDLKNISQALLEVDPEALEQFYEGFAEGTALEEEVNTLIEKFEGQPLLLKLSTTKLFDDQLEGFVNSPTGAEAAVSSLAGIENQLARNAAANLITAESVDILGEAERAWLAGIDPANRLEAGQAIDELLKQATGPLANVARNLPDGFNDELLASTVTKLLNEEIDAIQAFEILRGEAAKLAKAEQVLLDIPTVDRFRELAGVIGDASTRAEFYGSVLDGIGGGASQAFADSIQTLRVQETIAEAASGLGEGVELGLSAEDASQLLSGQQIDVSGLSEADIAGSQGLIDALALRETAIADARERLTTGDLSAEEFRAILAKYDTPEEVFRELFETLPEDVTSLFATAFASDAANGELVAAFENNVKLALNNPALTEAVGQFQATGDTSILTNLLGSLDENSYEYQQLISLIAQFERLEELKNQINETPLRANVPDLSADLLASLPEADVIGTNFTQQAGFDFDIGVSESSKLAIEAEVGTVKELISDKVDIDINTDKSSGRLSAVATQMVGIRKLVESPMYLNVITRFSGTSEQTGPSSAIGGIFGNGYSGRLPGFESGGLVYGGKRLIGGQLVRTGEGGVEAVLPHPRYKPHAFARTVADAAKVGFFSEAQANGLLGKSSDNSKVINYSPTYNSNVTGVSPDQILARQQAKEESDIARVGGLF